MNLFVLYIIGKLSKANEFTHCNGMQHVKFG